MNETRRAILAALADGPVTGPELAEALSVSRAAVWKHVEALRRSGFEIEGGPDGYVLSGATGYNAATIEHELDAPFAVEFHDSVGSTNAIARALAAEGAADLAVVADEQTGGRGRLDREWASPPGGVWLSVVCRPDVPPARAPLYTLAAAVATAEAAREAGVDARIKWPNDVVVPADVDRRYRKLAGILTEMEGETDRVSWLVCGVGVNANVDAEALPAGATSIRAERADVDRRAFVQRLLEGFHVHRTDLETVVDDWRDLAITLDEPVRVTLPDREIEGRAVDVTAFGALVVETGDGRVTVTAGDCEHLRPA